MKRVDVFAWIILVALLAGCAGGATRALAVENPTAAATSVTVSSSATLAVPQLASTEQAVPSVLTVMAHDSFAASEKVIADFETQNHVKISFLKGGDAGAALSRAILTKDAPQADILYGVDNTFLSRALDEDIYESYNSPALTGVPSEFKLDAQNRALPIDYGDICVNFDKAWFAGKKLAPPTSLEDLLKPEYKGLLVVENPAASSPGLGFLLASIVHFGGEKYLDYWKGLRANGLVVVNDWETAYYTNFSGSSGKGAQPMVVSYGTRPAAEVVFSKTPLTDSPTASILGRDACFRQIEFVGILKGTKNRALAEKFVDFMLGAQFQQDMPLQMFVFPVLTSAQLPNEFIKFIQKPDQPATMDPALVARNRSKWIDDWTQAVLR